MSCPKHVKKPTLTHSLIFRAVLVIIGIVSAAFVIVVIPIIINELYKCDFGYETIWDAADVLAYYGSILSGIITVLTVIITITFTSKQIKRERYLAKSTTTIEKLEEVVNQSLIDISPMKIINEPLSESDSLEYIKRWRNNLMEYQISIRLSLTMIESYINLEDDKDFSVYVAKFNKVTNYFNNLAEKVYQELSDSEADADGDVIDFRRVKNIVPEITDAYCGPYQDLIAAKRNLFDELYKKIDRRADDIISWNIKSKV